VIWVRGNRDSLCHGESEAESLGDQKEKCMIARPDPKIVTQYATMSRRLKGKKYDCKAFSTLEPVIKIQP
jgi:hypothetical protein